MTWEKNIGEESACVNLGDYYVSKGNSNCKESEAIMSLVSVRGTE